MRLDHLALSCTTLDEGCAMVAEALGVAPSGGGQHPYMATHNRLLSLGPQEYLEVIAIDPAAPPVPHPRWFSLDRFAGPPRLTNWICATDDLDAALAAAPPGAGSPVALSRGDFRWRMGVAPSGSQPFDDLFPPLIAWDGPHPAPRLPDHGLRLARLEISHPEALALREALPLADKRLVFLPGARALRATISTPHGDRVLC